MTAPDLPPRERIAEITCNIESSGSVYGVSHWCVAHNASAVDGKPYCNRGHNKADAVLAVLADLPDTAVEAGRVADHAHGQYRQGHVDGVHCAGSVDCHWRGESIEAWNAHRIEMIHTATIAAIKEGKA